MKVKYTINGKEVSRSKFLKKKGSFGTPMVSRAWDKPQVCEAMAVDPLEVKWEKMLDAEQGLNVRYNEHGAPVFESRAQRNAYIRAKGYYDKHAGYNDVSPINR